MKTVIVEPKLEENTISSKNLPQNPLIGILLNSGYKVTLIKDNYRGGLYQARCVHGWGNGNLYNPNKRLAEDLDTWLNFFKEHHKATIFLFDSPKELFKWLAE